MNAIVNVNKNWGIGKDGQLLCRLKRDTAFFKDFTMGKTVIYGRKTMEGFPNGYPLEGRKNIVITHTPSSIPEKTQHYAHFYGVSQKVMETSPLSGKNPSRLFVFRDQHTDSAEQYKKGGDYTSLFSVKNVREAIVLGSLLEADQNNIIICGGETIYRAMLPYCKYVQVTFNDCDKEADTFFPNLDELENWEQMTDGVVFTDEDTGIKAKFCRYRNKNVKSIYDI